MRNLQSRRNSGSLSVIDAVLGAAVILPSVMSPDSDCDVFDEFTEDTGKQILDMYFHSVNYWRECISAFVSQEDKSMRRKVIMRLTEVICFEEKIKVLLKAAPDDYVPPISQFLTVQNAVARSSLRFKKPNGKRRGEWLYLYCFLGLKNSKVQNYHNIFSLFPHTHSSSQKIEDPKTINVKRS